MRRNVYSAASLERVLASFEAQYGMSSEVFYEKLVRDQELPEIPGFHRHVWASFHRDVIRLRGDDFADQVERTLALA